MGGGGGEGQRGRAERVGEGVGHGRADRMGEGEGERGGREGDGDFFPSNWMEII